MPETTSAPPLGGFAALLERALGPLVDPHTPGFLEMMAEDAVMEFPFAPPGTLRRLEGRAALRTHLERINGVVDFEYFSEPTVHYVEGRDVVILEFSCRGRASATGRAYDQDYISVLTLRDGKIVRYQDYWNPLTLLDAVGTPALEQTFSDPQEGGA